MNKTNLGVLLLQSVREMKVGVRARVTTPFLTKIAQTQKHPRIVREAATA